MGSVLTKIQPKTSGSVAFVVTRYALSRSVLRAVFHAASILARSNWEKPFRSVVDFTDPGVGIVDLANGVLRQAREGFVDRMGYGELLKPNV